MENIIIFECQTKSLFIQKTLGGGETEKSQLLIDLSFQLSTRGGHRNNNKSHMIHQV